MTHVRSSLRRLVALCLLFLAVIGGPVHAQNPDQPQVNPPLVEIELTGARRYRVEQLIAALGHPLGLPLDLKLIEEGENTLWKAFFTRTNSVDIVSVPGGVKLVVDVYEIPFDLEPRFVGNDHVKTSKLLEWALLEERGEIYHHQVARVARRILEGYRSDGYYWASVETILGDPESESGLLIEGEEADAIDVIFRIQEGPIVRVEEVKINGNESLPDYGFGFWKGGLRHLAQTKLRGPHLFNWFGSRFVEDELHADIVALKKVFHDKGYLDAIVELDHLQWNKERSHVTPHVIIDEGPAYYVRSLSIEGVRLVAGDNAPEQDLEEKLFLPEADLLELCRLEPGARYELGLQRVDARKLESYYGERGYLSHPSLDRYANWIFLKPELRFDIETHQVDVTYRIAQGRKRFIREVLFAGAQHTRDRVLRREVTMLEGKEANTKDITRSLQRIRQTNFFSDATKPLEHKDPLYRFKATDDPDYVDLEYLVDEGRVVDFQIAGGVDSNSGVFGLISLSMRNFDVTDVPDSFFGAFGDIYSKQAFHGAGQQLDIQLSPGSQINRWRVHFNEPDLFRTHFKRYSLDLEVARQEREFDVYEEERGTRRIRIGRRFTPDFTALVGYLDSDVTVDDLDGGGLIDLSNPADTGLPQPLLRQAAAGEQDFNAVTLDLVYRQLDNFRNPREGWSMSLRNSFYDEAFGGDAEFAKSAFKIDYYHQLGEDVREVRDGIHINLGFGVADPYGSSSEVPYTERFFLGGFRTLRGFSFRGVGPNSGGQPIGGETFVHGSFEYRFPVHIVQQPGTFRDIEMFRITPFVDWGVLDEDAFSLDIDELRLSVGVGFGIAYPFPVTFNLGFPLKEGEGDDRQSFSFNLSLGQ